MSTLKLIFLLLFAAQLQGQTIHITGPAGSGRFGETVTVLTNGNYVVTDPSYDEGSIVNVGAVYLYNGSSHTLISTLKGSIAGDSIGSNGIVALSNGNFIVISPYWDNGVATNVGAITWCSGSLGLSGIISSSNSLVGSKANDVTGNNVVEISNGNYMAICPNWDNGAIADAGAATWGNGSTGISGVISSSNSLIGSSVGDFLNYTIFLLGNGNYLVKNPNWNNGTATDAGALTWCNSSLGLSGVISSSNSLVGSSTGDFQNNTVSILANGNYVVNNPYWSNIAGSSDAGAVTWGNGTTGVTGAVTSSNSLVGTNADDQVGFGGITILSNGNYVVISPLWDNGTVLNAGAVTWGSENTGISGIVSTSNSLTGSTTGDGIGSGGAVALSNGNYAVGSPNWDNGSNVNAGAATWADGAAGLTGLVSTSNSLTGGTSNDNIGQYIYALTNGNYVVCSPSWNNGTSKTGAATWGNGNLGTTGIVSSANSMVGNTSDDFMGAGVTALSNGNYVVKCTYWDNGTAINAGAVTWCNGTTGASGVINSTNSLVGRENNYIGSGGIINLNNGNYLVRSPHWKNEFSINSIGAITWGSGTVGVTGIAGASNSLVGSEPSGIIGDVVTVLSNGNYVVSSPLWGGLKKSGAVTWGSGITGVKGVVSGSNSLVGSTAFDGVGMVTACTNGNYIVSSITWDNGTVVDAGAVTFVNGNTGITGTINSSNSLIGSIANDRAGNGGITILRNGNYVVNSPYCGNGVYNPEIGTVHCGAVTWGSSTSGVSGIISNSNSLVGSRNDDGIANSVTAFGNGDYLITTPGWDNGAVVNAGAITICDGSIGRLGFINSCNSLLGTSSSGGNSNYDSVFNYYITGRPSYNTVDIIYKNTGLTLAVAQDSVSQNIYSPAIPQLIANSGCRIIATIIYAGGPTLYGTVKAKVWIEDTTPVYGGDPFVARHYQISPDPAISISGSFVQLYFTQQEFTDFNAQAGSILNLPVDGADAAGKANLRIGKYLGASINGSGLPGSYTGTPVIIDPNDADIVWNSSLNRWEVSFYTIGFGGFIVQTKAAPIPLQLLNFSAVLAQNDVLVSWKTTNEINTKNFEVERSSDGSNFTKLGSIGAINSGTEHFYHYNDTGAASLSYSKLYYRLKQVDNDGRYSYSPIVLVHLSRGNSVTFYPNPVSNIVTLRFSNKGLINTQAVLTDIQGKQVIRFDITNYQQQIDLGHLPSGTYLLKLADGTAVKLMKQ